MGYEILADAEVVILSRIGPETSIGMDGLRDLRDPRIYAEAAKGNHTAVVDS
jgi:hypothetical protein